MLIDSMIPEAVARAATSPDWSPSSASRSPPASHRAPERRRPVAAPSSDERRVRSSIRDRPFRYRRRGCLIGHAHAAALETPPLGALFDVVDEYPKENESQ
jgi:hypothetical protein